MGHFLKKDGDIDFTVQRLGRWPLRCRRRWFLRDLNPKKVTTILWSMSTLMLTKAYTIAEGFDDGSHSSVGSSLKPFLIFYAV